MIVVDHLTKRYGDTTAVDDLSFAVRDGVVTGFLGPNGAGKSTTMRMIVGLDRPNGGTATIDGKQHSDLKWPLHEVGSLLEARAIHPGRSAQNHLLGLAKTNGIKKDRVAEVLELVGLSSVAKKRVGKFSLGMGQRLGIATALLGDPKVLLLDEPVNGLDPEGIVWVRHLLKGLAAEGRTVLVSSHLMSEMALMADDLVVIGQGRLIAASSVDTFISSNTEVSWSVRASDERALAAALVAQQAAVEATDSGLTVRNVDATIIGNTARDEGIAIYQLEGAHASLEDVFVELTSDAKDFGSTSTIQNQNPPITNTGDTP